jgi:hypothetical protein
MVANPDLADVVSQAADSGAKVILAGDTQQLQAVENGGGLSLLAEPSASSSWPSRSGSAPPGNRRPACGSASAMLQCWPSTTGTPGSAAVSRSR